ncbi:pyrroline-5-carboxylate reductase [Helicobacter heilmannii]|uniref:Pyrroline-5-carboxylate reductase n=1 Tax=Helicobacter heilmannii TaxID=35817 RepID=A0A0K2YC20_HELHE|nr:pyrroline-5-carboxylate reductase [Helicobacter heilmannii]CCM10717.1 Pyrroline-5-carboxylate reductase [Helicobacter heilmannii ASB1.4]CRF47764.1 Pyrroline-5-carboxylate reductase [Helicobacter heilmannii]CRF49219.1 Pyrroline-5-carboxylate reductase [Helicobacter heilmannii]CRI35249.1 Pyrroline-5-carboxylate reductase [Helicobacter heilmannii]BDQ27908.1 pyrroline-5-carboxylate reductase [Helicobacter heilmannii]
MTSKILFIGYGQITRAILKGMQGVLAGRSISIAGKDPSKITPFLKQEGLEFINLRACDQNIDITDSIVFLTLKPHALSAFTYTGQANAILSALAGVSIEILKAHLQAPHFVRFMPNVAAFLGLSATTYYSPTLAPKECIELLASFGTAVPVDQEELIDASMVTNGSTLAFLSLFTQALIDSGVRAGLKHTQAKKLISQSFKGFNALLATQSPQEISQNICTPAGATIEGLSVLEEKGVRGAIMQACHATAKHYKSKS